MSSLTDIRGLGPALSKSLAALGISSPEALSGADPETLMQVRGISQTRAQDFIDAARTLTAQAPTSPEPPGEPQGKTAKKKPSKKKAKAADKKTDKKSSKPAKKKGDKKNSAKSEKKADKAKAKTKSKSGKKKNKKKSSK